MYGFLLKWEGQATDALQTVSRLAAENQRLLIENQRQLSTVGWFQHRLTQVEQERAALIYAATGRPDPQPLGSIKISSPNFVPDSLPDILNAQNNPFDTMGEDSLDPNDQIPAHEDYSHLPGARR